MLEGLLPTWSESSFVAMRSGQIPSRASGFPPAFFVSVASKRLRRYVSPLLATHTPQLVSVASKGLRGLHNYRSGAAFLAMSRPADALLGCGFDDGKEAASCRTPKCPDRAAASRADYRENWK